MKRKFVYVIVAALLIGALATAAPQMTFAAGTPACTQINNRAFVDFRVGGVQQTQIGSTDGSGNNNTSFYVGVKVNVTVATTNVANVTVYPNSTGTAVSFTVRNDGNVVQRYALSAIAEPNGTASPFSGSDIYDANNVTLSQAAIASLAPDASQAITITVDTPGAQTNGQVAVYALRAQTQWVGSNTNINAMNSTATGATINDGGACTALGATNIDVVAGDVAGSDDNANDGAHSARSAYQVTAASLTITKTSAVYWDPVNLTTNPKAIPGAVITYTVTIANAAGGANATNVSMIDNLNAEITALRLAFGNGQTGAPNTSFNDGTTNCTGAAGRGVVVGGVCQTNAYAAGDDSASWNDAADPVGGTNIVAVNGLTVNAGSSVVIRYQATVQ